MSKETIMASKAQSAARRRLERHVENGKSNRGPMVVNLPEGVDFFKLDSAAPKRVDILAYKVTEKGNPCADVGDEYFERTYFRHANVGPNGAMVVCRKRTFGEPCPICDFLKNDVDWDDKEQKETYKQLNAKERQLFNVYDTSDGDKGCQVWEVSYHNFGKQLDGELANADEDDEVDGFSSTCKEGKTLKIALEEKTIGKTTYYEATSINFKKRTTDHSDTTVHNLDKLISHPTYDEVKAILNGEEVEAKPEASKKKKAAATEAKEEDASDVFTCPGGGTYGQDCEKFDDVCAECPKWTECDDATDEYSS